MRRNIDTTAAATLTAYIIHIHVCAEGRDKVVVMSRLVLESELDLGISRYFTLNSVTCQYSEMALPVPRDGLAQIHSVY